MLQSLSVKFQLQIANFLINFESFDPSIKSSSSIRIEPSYLNKIYSCNLQGTDIFSVKWAEKDGNKFITAGVIQSGINIDDIPVFSLIKVILIINNEIHFCCQELNNHGFDKHFYVFRVNMTDKFFIINYNNLISKKCSYIFYGIDKNKLCMWD